MERDDAFAQAFIDALAHRALAALDLEACPGEAGGARLRFTDVADPARDAGCLRLWRGRGPVDRMVQARLAGAAADTHLLFLFGRPDTAMPHFHAQAVQFGPRCIYNADLLARLDPVDHPGHFATVFGPVTKAFWRATQDRANACAAAPGNPAIAVYLSPWSIAASRPTDAAELERVRPHVEAYLDQFLALARDPPPRDGMDAAALAARDRRYLERFFDEDLDPRAWKGVYRLIGEDAGHEMRRLLMSTLGELPFLEN